MSDASRTASEVGEVAAEGAGWLGDVAAEHPTMLSNGPAQSRAQVPLRQPCREPEGRRTILISVVTKFP
jgi:hypothetical protein